MDRRLLLRTAAAGGIAGLAGCGVASRNGVVVDGPGHPAGTGSGTNKQQPSKREVLNRPEDIVRGLLSQAAGDLTDRNQALQRWLSYLSPDHELSTTADIAVVWCDFDAMQQITDGDTIRIVLPMVPLGRLETTGQVTPNTTEKEFTLAVDVGPAPLDSTKDQAKPDRGLWVQDIYHWPVKTTEKNGKSVRTVERPTTMLLSSDALSTYYEYRSVYFWERGLSCLVPDVRYVPTAWEDATRLKKLVEWLFGGASGWLRPAVEDQGLSAVKVIGNPSPTSGRLVVNLSAEVAKANLDRLVSQLTWTLRREAAAISADPVNSPITINIESIEKKVGGSYTRDNATAVRTADPGEIEAFAIEDGRVHRLRGPQGARTPPPLISAELNQGVEWAAYCRDAKAQRLDAAAVVRRKDNILRLHLGPKNNLSSALVEVSREDLGYPQTMLQPVFVDSLNLFVVADGTIHKVARVTGKVESLRVSGIQALAVAPDGRRIAYIQGGALLVGSVLMVNGSVALGPARKVRTILSKLSGVAFTAEDWLVVSGERDGKTRVVEISLDGGLVGHHSPDDNALWVGGDDAAIPPITSLTAYPDNPLETISTKRVYVTAGAALNATSTFDPLTEELVDPQPGKIAVHPFFQQ